MPFPVGQEYIAACEQKLGLSFPDGFKNGMKELNGGEVEFDDEIWLIHPFLDSSDRKRIKRTANHIIVETESAKSWMGYPEGAVTIGRNDYGDLLVLVPEGKILKDVVYEWNHETGELEIISPSTEILMNSRR